MSWERRTQQRLGCSTRFTLLSVQDPMLRPHMQPILQALFANLQTFAKGAAGKEAQLVRLVIHVVNSLLAQLG